MQNERERLAGRLEGYEKSCGEQPAAGKSLPDLKTLTSAAAGLGLLLACPHAEAAIVYSGARNVSLSNNSFALDMDGDSVPEFDLFAYGFSFSGTTSGIPYSTEYGIAAMFPVGANAAWLGTTFPFPARLSSGYNFGPAVSSSLWGSGYGILAYSIAVTYSGSTYYSTSVGNFLGERGFIGVRFEISGETKYGWIDFEGVVGHAGQGIIHGWAYEDVSDTAIAAGATGEPIPTLNEWGMIFLVGLLAAGGLVYGRKEEELVS
ncbi:MAG: IPTL-CTERM sorting domain-containing protein [Pseudomonadota bacterium]|nr:IPTL-CTERM sorting domain-containing protein [Pseudomonadota bacterium]